MPKARRGEQRRTDVFDFQDGQDHAYDQPENKDKRIKFWFCGDDRVFWCAPWMAHQADSFFKLMRDLPQNLDLCVHGDGLIAHGLRRLAEGRDMTRAKP